jgi:cell cycle checkpoint protein
LQASQRYASLDSTTNQLVLIQDLPNTIGSSPLVARARAQFQTTLKEFLASSRVKYPVILIVTESELGSGEDFGYSSTQRDGLTVRGLLGDILDHQGTSHITYNPIAKTIMVKAMVPMFKGVPKTLLESIADISAGDVRSAINCATLVAMQLRDLPRRKVDLSMYHPWVN